MTYNIADGDTGFDRIFVAAIPSGTNSITVNATTAGYNTAFGRACSRRRSTRARAWSTSRP